VWSGFKRAIQLHQLNLYASCCDAADVPHRSEVAIRSPAEPRIDGECSACLDELNDAEGCLRLAPSEVAYVSVVEARRVLLRRTTAMAS
jgi:hypothetical protein